jgi:hypothetical protein
MRLDSAAVFALFIGLLCSACGNTPTPTAPSVTSDYSGKWSGVLVKTACTVISPQGLCSVVPDQRTALMVVTQVGTKAHVQLFMDPGHYVNSVCELDTDVSGSGLAFQSPMYWDNSKGGGVIESVNWTSHVTGVTMVGTATFDDSDNGGGTRITYTVNMPLQQ